MTPSPRIWIVTFAALVFLIGGLAGIVADRTWLLPNGVPRQTLGPGPGAGGGRGPGPGRGGGPLVVQGPERVIADLNNELSLSADQQTAIRAILEAWRPRVQALQNTARAEFATAQQELHAEISKTLTPEQAARFREISSQLLLQGGRGPGGGAGLGPPPGRGPRRGGGGGGGR
jgi:hypothetical protein